MMTIPVAEVTGQESQKKRGSLDRSRERKLNTNFFFSNFSGTSGISRQNPGISHPKSLISPGFEGHTELFGPHPFTWKDPQPHRRISGPESLGLGSFFFSDSRQITCFASQFPHALLWRCSYCFGCSVLLRAARFCSSYRYFPSDHLSDFWEFGGKGWIPQGVSLQQLFAAAIVRAIVHATQ